ncbi:hypothetical protein PCASD_17047 [Puccinia coronata f. sp. avenae]|uniref:Uncharacterized protein n=1 Tax=Puccinia coronata f. sp. avenae TaxID=200324 RepID=A0A2N5T9F0_9BASI|nr:hypothetical protein PCASD_17738 [Puccinia coronata f. sp. avenae]PLW31629.1 hypothetical protein PCASD_17047 [Puccinia coronata f. sp. avenae]
MPVVNQIGIESVTNVVRAGPQLTKVLRISSAAVFRGGITTGGHPEFLEITPGPVFIAKLAELARLDKRSSSNCFNGSVHRWRFVLIS